MLLVLLGEKNYYREEFIFSRVPVEAYGRGAISKFSWVCVCVWGGAIILRTTEKQFVLFYSHTRFKKIAKVLANDKCIRF